MTHRGEKEIWTESVLDHQSLRVSELNYERISLHIHSFVPAITQPPIE
jgi:hypothetical protein